MSGNKPAETKQHPGGGRPHDERVDEELEESFPASDPPSHTPTRVGTADVTPHEDEARGTPTSDRHATETAAGRHEAVEHPEQKHR